MSPITPPGHKQKVHRDAMQKGTYETCTNCHKGDPRTAKTEKAKMVARRLTVGCFNCHAHSVNASKKHRSESCGTCHGPAPSRNDVRRGRCSGCHEGSSGGALKEPARDGRGHGIPLHRQGGVTCDSCHAVKGNSSSCSPCHDGSSGSLRTASGRFHDDSNHTRFNSPLCTSCHGATLMPPLISRESDSRCTECHQAGGGVKKGSSPHHHSNSYRCSTCHTQPPATSRANALSLFAGSPCSTCHAPDGTVSAPGDGYHHSGGNPGICTGCHTTPPILIPSLLAEREQSTRCGQCHTIPTDLKYFGLLEYFKNHHEMKERNFGKPCLDCHDEGLRPKQGLDISRLMMTQRCTGCHGEMELRYFKSTGRMSAKELSDLHHEREFGNLSKLCRRCHDGKLEPIETRFRRYMGTESCAPCHAESSMTVGPIPYWESFVLNKEFIPYVHLKKSEECEECHGFHRDVKAAKEGEAVATHHTHPNWGLRCGHCHQFPPTFLDGGLFMSGPSAEHTPKNGEGHSGGDEDPGIKIGWLEIAFALGATTLLGAVTSRKKAGKQRATARSIEAEARNIEKERERLEADPEALQRRRAEEFLRVEFDYYDALTDRERLDMLDHVLEEVRRGDATINADLVRESVESFERKEGRRDLFRSRRARLRRRMDFMRRK